ncbi:MAG TPA: hypothetical protein V6D09_04020 [Leptolyngbyaceae cyanobacterium]
MSNYPRGERLSTGCRCGARSSEPPVNQKLRAARCVSRDEHRRGRLGRLSFKITDKLAAPACPVQDAHP